MDMLNEALYLKINELKNLTITNFNSEVNNQNKNNLIK
jgi:hypothetical protein